MPKRIDERRAAKSQRRAETAGLRIASSGVCTVAARRASRHYRHTENIPDLAGKRVVLGEMIFLVFGNPTGR